MRSLQPPSLRSFLAAFTDRWIDGMAGGASVVGTFVALVLPELHQWRMIVLILSIACLGLASFRVWAAERIELIEATSKLAVLKQTSPRLVLDYRPNRNYVPGETIQVVSFVLHPADAHPLFLRNDGSATALGLTIGKVSLLKGTIVFEPQGSAVAAGGECDVDVLFPTEDQPRRRIDAFRLGSELRKLMSENAESVPVSLAFRDHNDVKYENPFRIVVSPDGHSVRIER